MKDTLPAAEQVLLKVRRAMDPCVRLRQAFELSDALRLAALARLRAANPGLTERQLVARWLEHNRPSTGQPTQP